MIKVKEKLNESNISNEEKLSDATSSFKDEDTKGLYFSFMTRAKETSGIFDYGKIKSQKNINKINTFINQKRIWIIRDLTDNIRGVAQMAESSGSEILFFIRKKKEGFTLISRLFQYNLEPTLNNINKINNGFWYVINSDKKFSGVNIHNDDCYLTEGDIIKMAHVKFIVRKIFIQNSIKEEKEEQKEEIFDLNTKYIDYKICEKSGEKLFQFCKCHENNFQSIDPIKKWLDQHKIKSIENDKKTVINYIFELFRCKEELNGENKICNNIYPLQFKCLNKTEKGDIDEYIDLVSIQEPKNSSYMILESLYYTKDIRLDPENIYKSFHVIKLIDGEDITIGKNKNNDIRINNKSIDDYHAVIKYKDGKLLIKNRSNSTGTLVMIRQKEIKIEKEIYLQVDKTFIKVKTMEKEEFLKKKNEHTKYPFIDDKKKSINEAQELDNNYEDKVNLGGKESKNDYIPEPSMGTKFYNQNYNQ